jgi:hypothetical protein
VGRAVFAISVSASRSALKVRFRIRIRFRIRFVRFGGACFLFAIRARFARRLVKSVSLFPTISSQSMIYKRYCRLGNGGHHDTGAVLSLHTQRALPCGQLAQTDRWFSRLGKAWRMRWIPWLRFRRPTGALPGGRLMTSFATRAGTQGRLVGRVRLPLCPTTAAAAPTRHAPARSLHPAH